MTDAQTQVDLLRSHGWQQGSVLPASVVQAARDLGDGRWPTHLTLGTDDWLIVISHPCDVRNRRPDAEPSVEVLAARPFQGKKVDSRATSGKNSRTLHLEGQQSGATLKLVTSAFERFTVDRLLLAAAPPDPLRELKLPQLQMLIGWIAKRYQRQAFPDGFDYAVNTANAKSKVDDFLIANAKTLLGVYIAFADRSDQTPRFHVAFRMVVKSAAVAKDWSIQKTTLASAFEGCWTGVDGVEVEADAVQANLFSLGEIVEGKFKKFDRDWISYEHDPQSEQAPAG